jgi:hypothetical protein
MLLQSMQAVHVIIDGSKEGRNPKEGGIQRREDTKEERAPKMRGHKRREESKEGRNPKQSGRQSREDAKAEAGGGRNADRRRTVETKKRGKCPA